MKHLFFEEWLHKRVDKIKNIFGEDWFPGKKILEVGACHGDAGIEFLKLGADLLFTDVRASNLELLTQRLQDFEYVPHTQILDQNTTYDLGQRFDLVLHMGLLYHLTNWKQNLETVMDHTNCMILESAVYPLKLDKPTTQQADSYRYDSINGHNPVFSQENIEQHLTDIGCVYIRFDNAVLDTQYSWLYNHRPIRHLYSWRYGDKLCENTHYRRMWLVLR